MLRLRSERDSLHSLSGYAVAYTVEYNSAQLLSHSSLVASSDFAQVDDGEELDDADLRVLADHRQTPHVDPFSLTQGIVAAGLLSCKA